MGNISGKLLDVFERRPKGAFVGNGGQSGAVGLSCMIPGRAVYRCVFEGLLFAFAGVAKGSLISLEVGGLGGQMTLARAHLVNPRGLEFPKAHESVRLLWDRVLV